MTKIEVAYLRWQLKWKIHIQRRWSLRCCGQWLVACTFNGIVHYRDSERKLVTTYQDAGSRSNTTKLPPGLTLFEIWFHSACSLQIREMIKVSFDYHLKRILLLAVLDDKVRHATSAVFPCWQVEGDGTRRNFNKAGLFGKDWFGSLRSQVQNIGLFTGTDCVVGSGINLVAGSAV